jgi:hypothetical protein
MARQDGAFLARFRIPQPRDRNAPRCDKRTVGRDAHFYFAGGARLL